MEGETVEVAGVPCCQGGGHMACTVMAALTPGGLAGSWRQCAEALPPSFLCTSSTSGHPRAHSELETYIFLT